MNYALDAVITRKHIKAHVIAAEGVRQVSRMFLIKLIRAYKQWKQTMLDSEDEKY